MNICLISKSLSWVYTSLGKMLCIGKSADAHIAMMLHAAYIIFLYTGGFFLVCKELGARLMFHSFPVLFFILSWDQFRHTNSTFYFMISPQWLSKLRWLRPSVLWWVACELVFLYTKASRTTASGFKRIVFSIKMVKRGSDIAQASSCQLSSYKQMHVRI